MTASSTATASPFSLVSNFFQGAFGKILDKASGLTPETQNGILKTLQWGLSHAPEIGLAAVGLSGVIVDPVVLYLGYKVAGSSRDMFNRATDYNTTYWDEMFRTWQGYKIIPEEEAKKAKESKSRLKDIMKTLGLKGKGA